MTIAAAMPREAAAPRAARGLAAVPLLLSHYRIYRRFRRFTMVPRDAYLANLYLAARALAQPRLAGGCVVECGTWRGGMAAGLALVGGPERDYHFFDSFAGLPPAALEDGEEARSWQAADPDNCAASRAEFEAVIGRVGLPAGRLAIHAGFFDETFPKAALPPIAILRLDADWYNSTMQCLERFWDDLLPGALVLIDDYYAWPGCRKAVHAFLARRGAAEAIRQSRFGKVAYLWKA